MNKLSQLLTLVLLQRMAKHNQIEWSSSDQGFCFGKPTGTMDIEIAAEDHLSSSKQHVVSADHQYAGLGIHSFDLREESPSTRLQR